MKSRCYVIVSVLLIIISCSKEYEYDSSVLVASNSVATTLIYPLDKFELANIMDFSKNGDWLALSQYYAEYHASFINVKNGEIHGWLKMGVRKNEALEVSNLSVTRGGDIIALDFMKGVVHECNPNQISRSQSASTVIELPDSMVHLTAIKGHDFIISTGLYRHNRYRYYSLVDKSDKYYIAYPKHPDFPFLEASLESTLYASSILKLRPNEKNFVCADRRSGLIDICSINEGLIELVRRNCFYHPKIKLHDGDVKFITYMKTNINGFQDIAVSEDYIYALYSGKTYEDSGSKIEHCRTLIIFNWEGEHIKTLELDNNIKNISYDVSNDTLYGITDLQDDQVSIVSINI